MARGFTMTDNKFTMTFDNSKALHVFQRSKWYCPKHGEVCNDKFDYTIEFRIPDHQGVWCLKCVAEQIDILGIARRCTTEKLP